MKINKILVVDDDANICRLAQVALERIGGFDVEVFSSGQEVLACLPQTMPDVIILDLMMPGLDGLAVLERIKNNPATAAIPVILMTAKIDPEQIIDSKALGALGVIEKPFEPVKLPQQILAFFK
jgi:two-component system, OmpR family, response regulator